RYGGIERVIAVLAEGLQARGHEVTLFAAGDSSAPCRLLPVVPRSLWPVISGPRAEHFTRLVAEQAADHQDEFDVIHSHLENYGFQLARESRTPVLTTLHGRVDVGQTAADLRRFGDVALVAISESQRRSAPHASWLATIHHGLFFGHEAGISAPVASVETSSSEYLLFVGRIASEKGIADAIEVARRSRLPLLIAAKAHQTDEQDLFHQLVRPAVETGVARFLGEVTDAQRDRLFSHGRATLMLGRWPEPFGLVAIESLACGTPVIARAAGALPEIVAHGQDGFLVEDVPDALHAVAEASRLDRRRIRARALLRFSAERMIDRYEDVYRRLLATSTKNRTLAPLASVEPAAHSKAV
ncbi:MAG: glycosyltransferase family 4 protein, partial [Chloroflexota bacterium]|nr:glycosyltransferase family 4 protein [Chloroflexota bacterium]